MRTKLKALLRTSLVSSWLVLLLSFGFSGAASALSVQGSQVSMPVQVANINSSKQAACQGIALTGGHCGGGGQQGINRILKVILNIISAIAGLIAVIMIIIAGIKFSTSGGDGQKLATAKSTLTYAIVGLIVVAISQIIVRFVIGNVT